MGQEEYFTTAQEAEQFIGKLVVEIFRYEYAKDLKNTVPVFICFDFMITEAMSMISQAVSLSEQSLQYFDPAYFEIVSGYLQEVRQLLGNPFPDHEINQLYFREDLAWRNRSIAAVENLIK